MDNDLKNSEKTLNNIRKMLLDLEIYVLLNESNEHLLMQKKKALPLFISLEDVEKFKNKNKCKDCHIEKTRLRNLIDENVKHYVLNPTTNPTFINKKSLYNYFEKENTTNSLFAKLGEPILIHEMGANDEIILKNSILNKFFTNQKVRDEYYKNFGDDEYSKIRLFINSPFIYVNPDYKDITLPEDETTIPIFSNLNNYLTWKNKTNFNPETKPTYLMGTLDRYIKALDYMYNFLINPGINDELISREDYFLANEEDYNLGSIPQEPEEIMPQIYEGYTIPKDEYGYDIKIRLNNYRPLTWRDLIIPANITFNELHKIIQIVMGLYNNYLYIFEIPKGDTLILDNPEYTIEKMKESNNMKVNHENKKSSRTSYIEDYLDSNKKILYTYDFTDNWEFTIEIKKKIKYDKSYATLKRFKGEHNPIDRCGGVTGLKKLVDTENQELILFDPNETQEKLKNMYSA